jgi:mono/diheme cytochrome c family protein
VAGALALVLAAGAAGRAADLRFVRDGDEVARLDPNALQRGCRARPVEVDDPYYEARKTFLACPLAEVLALGFGRPVDALGGREVIFRALDGYAKPVPGERLAETGGYLAFGDAGREGAGTRGFAPMGRAGIDPGPFYVVWTGAEQRDTRGYPWPYQLASVEIVDPATLYPHTRPTSVPPDAPAWRGFAIFRGECIACHAINGEGGKVGPDLNVPQSIVEYRPVEQVKQYIRDPSTFRYGSMPAHPNLTPADLDALVAYFEAMRSLKHDPRGSR